MPKMPLSGCGFGVPYARGFDWLTPEGVLVEMWRKGQRVRFFDADCKQHGPEQYNVAPAIAYAYAHGWEPSSTTPGPRGPRR